MKDIVLETKPILDRFRLDGMVALVTGGGQGIGRAYCHALGEAGASVAVVDKVAELANEVAKELSARKIRSLGVVADITRRDEIDKMMKRIVSEWGKLDIGVNNAGVGEWQAAEEVQDENWSRVIDLNLKAAFLCAQAEAREMFRHGYGKIINTASMSGHIVNTPQNQVLYNTSKAGVLHMTRSLAAEWADRGIRVNSISPGYTRTQLVEKLIATPEGKSMMGKWLGMIPLRRMAEVTDLQGAVVYLASSASDYMTGSDLVVDGGYCAW